MLVRAQRKRESALLQKDAHVSVRLPTSAKTAFAPGAMADNDKDIDRDVDSIGQTMSETLVQRPTPIDLLSPPIPSMPEREVINVEDWADGLIELSPSPRPRPRERRPNPPREVIDVDEISEGVEIVAGPSRPRREHRRSLEFITVDSDSGMEFQ